MGFLMALITTQSQFYLVTVHETLDAVWMVLCQHFEQPSAANKVQLKRMLFQCQMSPWVSMDDHLHHVKELMHKLAALGAPVSEEDHAAMLLNSLPSSYITLVTALTVCEGDVSVDYMQQAFLNVEQHQMD